jgi:hypothetical protein
VSNSPRDAGDWKREDEQRDDLRGQIHVRVFLLRRPINSALLSCNAITVLFRSRGKTLRRSGPRMLICGGGDAPCVVPFDVDCGSFELQIREFRNRFSP